MKWLPLLCLLCGCEALVERDRGREAEASAATCNDGADNDGDGLIDCAQPSCQPYCTCIPVEDVLRYPALCNGRDDDCDGKVDEVDFLESFEAASPNLRLSGSFERVMVAGARDGAWVMAQDAMEGDSPGTLELVALPPRVRVRVATRLFLGRANVTFVLSAVDSVTGRAVELDRVELPEDSPHDWRDVVLDPGGPENAAVRYDSMQLRIVARTNTNNGMLVPSAFQLDAITLACPGGGTIVYSSDETTPGTPTIWTMTQDGSNRRQITTTPGQSPRFTPDGAAILFSDYLDRLQRVPVGGGAATVLAEQIDPEQFAVAPDGSALMLASATPCTDDGMLYLLGPFGGTKPSLVSTPLGRARQPDWSAAGRTLVMTSGSPCESGALYIDAGGGFFPVALATLIAHTPRISPIRIQVIFTDKGQLLEVTGENSVPRRWDADAPAGTRYFLGGFSPSGSRVVFSRCAPPDQPCELWTARSDGSNLQRLAGPPATAVLGMRSPAWFQP